MNKKLLHM